MRVGSVSAGLAALLAGCGEAAPPAGAAVASEPEAAPLRASAPPRLVVAAAGRRHVPAEVRATSEERTAQPPLRLLETRSSTSPGWRARRALVEDAETGDVRAFAVGDLLPHGAALVGIEPRAMSLVVGDAVVLRVDVEGRWRVREDLRRARRPRSRRPRRRVRHGLSASARAEAREAAGALVGARGEALASAIEALLGAGEAVVPILLTSLDDTRPVLQAEVEIDGVPTRAVLGVDRAIALLEAITGHSFGDPLEARADVVEAWKRWGGG
jgi:hypothetical protein